MRRTLKIYKRIIIETLETDKEKVYLFKKAKDSTW